MIWHAPRGPASGRDHELAPPTGCRSYVQRQLWRKGLRHPARLAEGVDVALHLFAIEAWRRSEPPADWRGWRALLDRAVYQAMSELRPCATASVDLDSVSAPRAEGRADPDCDRGRALCDRVERLPVPQRLVVKLKVASVFLPKLPDVPVGWRADEVVFLLRLHRGRLLADLEAEFHERLVGQRIRFRGKVPAPVIAWLLGRASGPAVDSAFLEIKAQLRRPAPPGPAILVISRPDRAHRPEISPPPFTVQSLVSTCPFRSTRLAA